MNYVSNCRSKIGHGHMDQFNSINSVHDELPKQKTNHIELSN